MRRATGFFSAYFAYSAFDSSASTTASERLKLEVPRSGGVLLNRKLTCARGRQFVQRHSGSPALCQGSFYFGRRHIEVHQKLCVAAASTVIRFFRWHRQKPIHEQEIEIQQECPVKQDRAALPSLGVAGEFSADRKS